MRAGFGFDILVEPCHTLNRQLNSKRLAQGGSLGDGQGDGRLAGHPRLQCSPTVKVTVWRALFLAEHNPV
jgi:hypothetical protein